MTKREWDAETRINYGCFMGSRWVYRRERGLVDGRDFIADRGWEMARRNRHYRNPGFPPVYANRDGMLPTLGRGSRFRTLAAYRAKAGRPLLRVS